MMMLEINDVSKTYANGVKALDNVNLRIKPGLFGLLGPNGAGKSSLMRTIATLQNPDRGSIRFDNVDIEQDPQAIRQRLGYLPQGFGVYPRISAFDLLDHLALLKGLADRKSRHQRVNALLAQTNLYDVRKKSVSAFSGGMRQRFGIAQALVSNPDLIIVDEPTAGLDPEERNRFHTLLSDIGQDRVVILSTHIVDDVEELCASMAVLANGRVLESGSPAELIRKLQGTVWQKSVHRDALPEARAEFNVISTRLNAGQTLVRVVAEERPAEQFSPATADLEDVYFSALAHAA